MCLALLKDADMVRGRPGRSYSSSSFSFTCSNSKDTAGPRASQEAGLQREDFVRPVLAIIFLLINW